MPKEIVVESERFRMDSDNQGVVEVSWSPQDEIRVATYARHPETLEVIAESARYVTLDRDGCQQLIRNVRRARSVVYGKDE